MSKPKIKASNEDWNGNIIDRPTIRAGTCKFPFLYNDELVNECIPGKLGWWCATKVDKESKGIKKIGFCEIDENKEHSDRRALALFRKMLPGRKT